jgi:hypothetical protein
MHFMHLVIVVLGFSRHHSTGYAFGRSIRKIAPAVSTPESSMPAYHEPEL